MDAKYQSVQRGSATSGDVRLFTVKRPVVLCTLLLAATPALAQVGAPLDERKLGAADYVLERLAGLDRAYYFAGDNHTLVNDGEIERYIDSAYCAAADPVQPDPLGGFTITVRVATAQERAACHMRANEVFLSGLVTTRRTFSATYGYWEMKAQLPTAMRTWPAFWLLPTAKTAANKGAVPEIDVMEEYAGVLHGVTGTNAWMLDRTGHPISTLHLAGGAAPTCGVTAAEAAPGSVHTYGVLWEPAKLTFYVDDIETCEIDQTISDPHYLIVNVTMDGRPYTPGPTSPAVYPATMDVELVRHRPLSAP